MQYYIRQHKYAEVFGPYTVHDLATGVGAGGFSRDSLASSDLGERGEQLRRWRSCDWFPLSSIAELQSFFPPAQAAAPQRRRIRFVAHILQALSVPWFIYFAVTHNHWFDWLIAALMLLSAIQSIMWYARQRKSGATWANLSLQ